MSYDYSTIDGFKFWCQKVLPLIYDESLSYYEVLCKMQSKLNEVIENQNNLNENFKQLLEWIDEQLKKYTTEQLTKWLDDGTILTILNDLYDKFEISLDEFQNKVNMQLSTMDSKINGISSGGISPKFVNSTDEMTNQNQIYVLSSNGHLYYYNGSNFADSGIVYGLTNGYIHYVGSTDYPSDDLNTFPSNSVFVFLTQEAISNIKNLPENRPGIFLSFGNTLLNGGLTQLYSTATGVTYIRVIWGTSTTNWIKITNEESLDNLMRSLQNTKIDNLSSILELCTFFISSDDNIPIDAPVHEQGIFYCMGGTIANSGIQQYYTTATGKMFTRIIWGPTINEWIDITPKETPENQSLIGVNLLSAYSKVTCCGDSLTYSQVYTSDTSSRQAIRPYPIVIQKLLNINLDYYADPGISADEWWEKYNSNINHNGLYIIYLGTNNGLTETVDTDCVGDNLDNYAKTQTGYYGRILQKIKNVNGKAILIKVYATKGDLTTTNNALTDLANRFNCAIIENKIFNDSAYHLYPDGSGLNEVHYNDLGYTIFADYVINQIANLSNEMKEKILPQQ